MAYDDAVATLYQSSPTQFVEQRKQLALALKAGGDKAGAARLGKLARPTLSAWAVNQLWWQAREAFEALLASSERLRQGDRGAAGAHREALLSLRGRAAVLLTDAGHAVTDGTLRRVTTTLTALAATGSFAPDAPGALAADRDPPGFEALGSVTSWSATTEPSVSAERVAPSNVLRSDLQPEGGAGRADAKHEELERRQAAEAAARVEAERRRSEADAVARVEAERRRQEAEAAARAETERRREEERAQREAARGELEAELARARAELATGEREVVRLRTELAAAEGRVARARTRLREVETRSAAFGAVG